MKFRIAIVAFTLLAGSAATTFAGERGRVEVRDHRANDRHDVVIRHDDGRDIGRGRDFHHHDFPIVRYDRGCTIGCDR